MRPHILDRISFISLFLVIVLLPVFFLPFTGIPVETSKGLLLVFGLAVCVVSWAIARFTDGKIIFPRSPLVLSGCAVVLAVLLSALALHASPVSFFGTMFDIGSFWFIFTGFILMFMSGVIFHTPKRAKILLLGTILSSALVLVFQGLRLFIPTILSLGVFSDKTGNVVGSWNALGLFAGFAGLMFLLVIEFFPISKVEKVLLQIFMLLSILLAAAVNFPLVWILLSISSLIIFVYKISVTFQKGEKKEEGGEKKHFPIISFAVVMISILFFMSGQLIGAYIPNHLQISNTEVSPSFVSTMSVTKGVLSHHPIFGIGPNRFASAWSLYKPQVINSSQFWDASFDSGSGLLPTLTATTGILGILAWITFLVLFLYLGAKLVFSGIKYGVNWEMMAFFLLSLYLFISAFFYPTGAVMFLLLLAFTGVFTGLTTKGAQRELSISFLNDHRKSFFSILALILVTIFSIVLAFIYMERFASVFYFEKSLSASTIPAAEDSINKAVALYPNDLYMRTYAQIYLVKLNSIIGKGGTLSDADKADSQESFSQAIRSAELATTYDPQNSLNFELLGSIYQAVGSLGVKDAYSNAVTAFQSASALNPLNPGLKLSLARASFADGKVEDAKTYAKQALTLKPDYIDALVVLSQIAKSQGDTAAAVSYGNQALALSPTDKNLLQYVNSLSAPTPPVPLPAKSKQ